MINIELNDAYYFGVFYYNDVSEEYFQVIVLLA